MKKNSVSRSAGSSLIEVLIITVLVASILTAVASLVAQSLKNTGENKREALARDLAQEGLEVFRSQRQSLGWTSFQADLESATYCLNELPSTSQEFVDMQGGGCEDETVAGTEFAREAVVVSNNPEVTVTINVTWNADEIKTVSASQTFRDIQN